MSEKQHTTMNGYEITAPRERLTSAEFKTMAAEYGFTGQNPTERVANLRDMKPEQVAFFLTDLNRRLQGSEETLIADHTMKIGDKETIKPEDRATLFTGLLSKIDNAKDVSPERIGDALGLGIVLLHPFRDGNGRTSRMMGLMFREEFDQPDYENDFNALAESRDIARERGGFVINGYIPYLPEGADQGRAEDVDAYFDALLHDGENPRLYTGPAGQAPLHTEVE